MFRDTMSAVTPLMLYIAVELLASFLVTMGWSWYRGIGSMMNQDLGQIQQQLINLMTEDYALISYGTMIVRSILGIPLFAYIFMKDEKGRVLSYLNDTTGEGKREWISERHQFPAVAYVILLIGGAATCIVGSNLITLSGIESQAASYETIEALFLTQPIWMQVVISGILAPLSEELLFRGLIFRRFNRSSGVIAAMFWSSLVFACFHGNLVQGVYAMAIGFILCFVYYRYRSLNIAIVLHMVINMTSILLNASGALDFIYTGYVPFFGVTILCMALIVACLYGIEVWVRPVTENSIDEDK